MLETCTSAVPSHTVTITELTEWTDIPGTQTVDLVGDCLDLQKGLVLIDDVQLVLLVVIIIIGSIVL
jgi:hypothetical protein